MFRRNFGSCHELLIASKRNSPWSWRGPSADCSWSGLSAEWCNHPLSKFAPVCNCGLVGGNFHHELLVPWDHLGSSRRLEASPVLVLPLTTQCCWGSCKSKTSPTRPKKSKSMAQGTYFRVANTRYTRSCLLKIQKIMLITVDSMFS